MQFTFEDQLYWTFRNIDDILSIEDVVEEWLWFIEKNGVEINKLSLEAYTRTLLKCSEHILKE